ncbi:MAG: pentapeptide repeat-containing protein [Methanotrichaceae archaeon]|nr:pentapeptide repeat-containing protein [Methanotrichaceae archaeon]
MASIQAFSVLAILIMAVAPAFGAPKSPDPAGQISAQVILEGLASGENVILDGSTIVEYLDLSGREETVKGSLALTNCTISDDVDFRGVTFEGDLDFGGSVFVSKADFQGACFSKGADFRECQFEGEARFPKARFLHLAEFSNAKFHDSALFGGARFEDARFREAEFLGRAYFTRTEFNQSADFVSAVFSKAASIKGEFRGPAYFIKASFDDDLTMMNCIFGDKSYFREATFGKSANMHDSKFHGTVEFDGSTFGGEAILQRSVFEDNATFRRCRFNDNANLGDVRFVKNASFSEASFSKRAEFENSTIGYWISLSGAEYGSLLLRWHALERHLVYDKYVFKRLIENYKSLGWYLDLTNCYYSYRSEEMERKNWGISKGMDAIALYYCGYGVRPQYSLFWMALIVILFGYYYRKTSGVARPKSLDLSEGMVIVAAPLGEGRYRINSDSHDPPKTITLWEHLLFSAKIFSLKSPSNLVPSGRGAAAASLERKLGWLLFGVFAALLTDSIFSYFLPKL